MTSGGGGWSEVEKGGCEVELISIWKLMICLRSSSGGEAAGWWRKEYGCNPGGGQTRTWEETAADGGKEGEDKTALLKVWKWSNSGFVGGGGGGDGSHLKKEVNGGGVETAETAVDGGAAKKGSKILGGIWRGGS